MTAQPTELLAVALASPLQVRFAAGVGGTSGYRNRMVNA